MKHTSLEQGQKKAEQNSQSVVVYGCSNYSLGDKEKAPVAKLKDAANRKM